MHLKPAGLVTHSTARTPQQTATVAEPVRTTGCLSSTSTCVSSNPPSLHVFNSEHSESTPGLARKYLIVISHHHLLKN
ncbi:Protein of unknown function [Pyronema omphalodes CBS 100304]|uniref:Uncharacterized protein n=1 Tax=Pyronema omphalodes (strain CBS 100304) TaxID=1076935 RepID=U4LK48_PYROM|nr:Protein of unknown function [Pyronema omphalodes CBS 100304]